MQEKSVIYFQPTSLDELQGNLHKLTSQSLVLAGGTDLMLKLRLKKTEVDCIMSLCQIEKLREIKEETGWLRLGAMVTHAAAADSPVVEKYFHALQMACSHVGSQQIRNKGTLGGSLVNASPAGDIMPCVFLYGGVVEILGVDGYRKISIEEFLTKDGRTVLQSQEILTAILLPIEEGRGSCFVKLGSRKEVTIAQISLCASWREEAGNKRELRAYVGAVDSRPVPFEGSDLLVAGETGDETVVRQATDILSAQIQEIQSRRKRESKLKITEAEKQYKKRAVRGIISDVINTMQEIGREREFR